MTTAQRTAADAPTLAHVLRRRATDPADANRIAFTFLSEGASRVKSLTWSELDQRAAAGARVLIDAGAAGQPVMLALPSGLAFLEALFACWYAGAIGVPMSLPRHQSARRRADQLMLDAGARLAIGSADTRTRLEALAAEGASGPALQWLDLEQATILSSTTQIAASAGALAILQYTSGSTGCPRGVMVTHANIMSNCANIIDATGHTPADTIGTWLPLFHDMGLIGMIQTVLSGAHCVFMSPERFLMRPELWLKMISDYRICTSVAPNFAYELCVDRISETAKASLNLSCLRNALNGSESIRPSTLDRFTEAFAPCGFRREAFLPCYGLAEATLLVTAPRAERSLVRRTAEGELLGPDQPGGHVGCGTTFHDTEMVIVNPETMRRAAPGAIGEIWVAGASCAAGYWKNPAATAATFNAKLESDPRSWLRTGDLGFVCDRHLFITGRLRDLIKIAGRNHFPSDLEQTAEAVDPAIAPMGCAAFSIVDAGLERLIVAVEMKRKMTRGATGFSTDDIESLRSRVRAAIARDHDVTPRAVVVLKSGALSRTTSGKISRRAVHDAYRAGTLEQIEGAVDGVAVI